MIFYLYNLTKNEYLPLQCVKEKKLMIFLLKNFKTKTVLFAYIYFPFHILF